MERKKSLIFASVFLFLFMFSILSVSATTTINTPSASSTIGGSTAFNVTVTDGTVPERENLNLTFYLKSSLTANNTWAVIGTNNSLNFTLTANQSITTINLAGLIEDANDYILNVTVKNSTGSIIGSDTNTGMIVDQTVPQTPTLSPASNPSSPQTSSTTQTFTATVTGANTTSCTYVIARGGASSGSDYITGTATHSGNTCTFTKAFTATTDNGNWKWYVTASDETNSSTSATNDYVAQLTASNGGLPPGEDSSGESGDTAPSSGVWWIIAIIMVILVIAVIFWLK